MGIDIVSEVMELKRVWESKKTDAIRALLNQRKEINDRRLAEIAEVDLKLKELGYAEIVEPTDEKTESAKKGRPLSYDTRLTQRAKWKIRQGKNPDEDPEIVANPDLQSRVKQLIAAGDTGFSPKRQKKAGEAPAHAVPIPEAPASADIVKKGVRPSSILLRSHPFRLRFELRRRQRLERPRRLWQRRKPGRARSLNRLVNQNSHVGQIRQMLFDQCFNNGPL